MSGNDANKLFGERKKHSPAHVDRKGTRIKGVSW